MANDATVKRDYAVLSEAILSGASPQIRNMASTAGNLLQRTRCPYFRDLAHKCNKHEPGSGCDAMEGHNRMLAILGTSEHCIATNPSDQNVALMALEAVVEIRGQRGNRNVPIAEFYKLPGTTPNIETVLEPGDLITAVQLPAPVAGARSGYLKLQRPCGVRVCAGVSGCGAGRERRQGNACACGAGRCRDDSMEGARGRGGVDRQAGDARAVCACSGGGAEGCKAAVGKRIQGGVGEAVHRACTRNS